MEGAIPKKKESIIEAAIRVFAEKGFHPAGMREIAEQARVAIGTIYHYFKSKEDILIQIFREEIESRRRFLEELRASGLSIREQFQQILAMHFDRITENKRLVILILMERLEPNERFQRVFRSLYEEIAHYIEELIAEGIEKGEIAPCNSLITAYALMGAIEAVTSRGVLYDDQKAAAILREAPKELACSLWRWLGAIPQASLGGEGCSS
ncbi:MAG: TetR/AcrR family transcriptional regulator [Candidatus Bipolaricaulia bacterium]